MNRRCLGLDEMQFWRPNYKPNHSIYLCFFIKCEPTPSFLHTGQNIYELDKHYGQKINQCAYRTYVQSDAQHIVDLIIINNRRIYIFIDTLNIQFLKACFNSSQLAGTCQEYSFSFLPVVSCFNNCQLWAVLTAHNWQKWKKSIPGMSLS